MVLRAFDWRGLLNGGSNAFRRSSSTPPEKLEAVKKWREVEKVVDVIGKKGGKGKVGKEVVEEKLEAWIREGEGERGRRFCCWRRFFCCDGMGFFGVLIRIEKHSHPNHTTLNTLAVELADGIKGL